MESIANFACRSCGGRHGRMVLDLGVQPLANNLLRREDFGTEEPRFPLRVAICVECWLLQITETVPPVTLFSEYLYFSSVSDALLRHAADAAAQHIREGGLGAGSRIVEIASNDGYLLRNFVAAGIPCLGVEPAANIAKVAIEKGIPTINRFFNLAAAGEIADSVGRADLILGNNVFAHAPDTNDFVAGLARLLKPGGRIALEFPYACDLVEHLEFDTIYHEHVFYFTLTALLPLFSRHGLEVFRVQRLGIHGGSLRLFAAHKGAQIADGSAAALLAEEQAKGVEGFEYYAAFRDRVHGLRAALLGVLRQLKNEGRRICAYGASAKGSTLLNFYGIGREGFDCIDFVADRSPAKQGRFTPGSHLPILSPEEMRAQKSDYALLLTWNFAEEILRQQQAFRDAGGRFIVPLPEVRIV
jgi:SAM-dependent methyltransferase